MDEVELAQLRSIDPQGRRVDCGSACATRRLRCHSLEVAADADISVDRARLTVLEHLAAAHVLTKAERTACPQCQQPLSTGDEQCPRCQLDLVGLEPSITVSYRRVTVLGATYLGWFLFTA